MYHCSDATKSTSSRTTIPAPPTTLRWDDLPVFLAALRGGTLPAAAGHLGIDASTVSRRLTALEAALATSLFERSRLGLHPTEAALRLQPLAEQAEAAVAALQRERDTLDAEVDGEVRIACPDGVATELLPPVLATLRARHPRLVPVLLCGIEMVDLGRREADLALRTWNPPGDGLVTRRLSSLPVGVFGTEALVERHRDAALAELPWITWDSRHEHLEDARFLASIGARVVLRASTLPAHHAAARAGVGFVLGVAEACRGLTRWPGQTPAVKGSLWITTHRTTRHAPRVAAVWDAVVEALATG